MELSEYKLEELEAELKRRRATKPTPLEEPNFDPLILRCQLYIDDIANKTGYEEDNKFYIFTEAIEAIYGSKVWEWINNR